MSAKWVGTKEVRGEREREKRDGAKRTLEPPLTDIPAIDSFSRARFRVHLSGKGRKWQNFRDQGGGGGPAIQKIIWHNGITKLIDCLCGVCTSLLTSCGR